MCIMGNQGPEMAYLCEIQLNGGEKESDQMGTWILVLVQFHQCCWRLCHIDNNKRAVGFLPRANKKETPGLFTELLKAICKKMNKKYFKPLFVVISCLTVQKHPIAMCYICYGLFHSSNFYFIYINNSLKITVRSSCSFQAVRLNMTNVEFISIVSHIYV